MNAKITHRLSSAVNQRIMETDHGENETSKTS